MNHRFWFVISLSACALLSFSVSAFAEGTYFEKLYGAEYRNVNEEMRAAFVAQYTKPWDDTTFSERRKFLLRWHKTHLRSAHAYRRIARLKARKIMAQIDNVSNAPSNQNAQSLIIPAEKERKVILEAKKRKDRALAMKKKKEAAIKKERLRKEQAAQRLKEQERKKREQEFRKYVQSREKLLKELRSKQNQNR